MPGAEDWGQASQAVSQRGPLGGPRGLPPGSLPLLPLLPADTEFFQQASPYVSQPPCQEPVLWGSVAAGSRAGLGPRPQTGAPPAPLRPSLPIPSANSSNMMEPPMASNPDLQHLTPEPQGGW